VQLSNSELNLATRPVIILILLSIVLLSWLIPLMDKENGELIFARDYPSGFTYGRYDEVVAIFDSGNIYKFTINEDMGLHFTTNNTISSGRINCIMNQFEAKTNIKLKSTYKDIGYYFSQGRKGLITLDEISSIKSLVANIDFNEMNNSYYNKSAPTEGSTTFLFASTVGNNKTVSGYGFEAPSGFKTFEDLLNQFARNRCY